MNPLSRNPGSVPDIQKHIQPLDQMNTDGQKSSLKMVYSGSAWYGCTNAYHDEMNMQSMGWA